MFVRDFSHFTDMAGVTAKVVMHDRTGTRRDFRFYSLRIERSCRRIDIGPDKFDAIDCERLTRSQTAHRRSHNFISVTKTECANKHEISRIERTGTKYLIDSDIFG